MIAITLEFPINFQRTDNVMLIFQSMNIVYPSIHLGYLYFSKKYFNREIFNIIQ